MERIWLMVLLLAVCPTALAAAHSEEWCADAVDFSMQTAMYRELGRGHDRIDAQIDRDYIVLRQQYPSLSRDDMHGLAGSVFAARMSHFEAAQRVSKACDARGAAPVPTADLRAGHSDDWCATAVDFAMVTAQNRSFGYTHDMLLKSVKRNPYFYHVQFPELSQEQLQSLTNLVFREKWTRFGAASSVSKSCKVARVN